MSETMEALGFLVTVAGFAFAGMGLGAYIGMRRAIKLGRNAGIPIRGRNLRSQYHNLITDLDDQT